MKFKKYLFALALVSPFAFAETKPCRYDGKLYTHFGDWYDATYSMFRTTPDILLNWDSHCSTKDGRNSIETLFMINDFDDMAATLERLMKLGADVNWEDQSGNRPLDYAVYIYSIYGENEDFLKRILYRLVQVGAAGSPSKVLAQQVAANGYLWIDDFIASLLPHLLAMRDAHNEAAILRHLASFLAVEEIEDTSKASADAIAFANRLLSHLANHTSKKDPKDRLYLDFGRLAASQDDGLEGFPEVYGINSNPSENYQKSVRDIRERFHDQGLVELLGEVPEEKLVLILNNKRFIQKSLLTWILEWPATIPNDEGYQDILPSDQPAFVRMALEKWKPPQITTLLLLLTPDMRATAAEDLAILDNRAKHAAKINYASKAWEVSRLLEKNNILGFFSDFLKAKDGNSTPIELCATKSLPKTLTFPAIDKMTMAGLYNAQSKGELLPFAFSKELAKPSYFADVPSIISLLSDGDIRLLNKTLPLIVPFLITTPQEQRTIVQSLAGKGQEIFDLLLAYNIVDKSVLSKFEVVKAVYDLNDAQLLDWTLKNSAFRDATSLDTKEGMIAHALKRPGFFAVLVKYNFLSSDDILEQALKTSNFDLFFDQQLQVRESTQRCTLSSHLKDQFEQLRLKMSPPSPYAFRFFDLLICQQVEETARLAKDQLELSKSLAKVRFLDFSSSSLKALIDELKANSTSKKLGHMISQNINDLKANTGATREYLIIILTERINEIVESRTNSVARFNQLVGDETFQSIAPPHLFEAYTAIDRLDGPALRSSVETTLQNIGSAKKPSELLVVIKLMMMKAQSSAKATLSVIDSISTMQAPISDKGLQLLEQIASATPSDVSISAKLYDIQTEVYGKVRDVNGAAQTIIIFLEDQNEKYLSTFAEAIQYVQPEVDKAVLSLK